MRQVCGADPEADALSNIWILVAEEELEPPARGLFAPQARGPNFGRCT